MSTRVILTGASSGIGRSLAIEYARRKGALVLVARRGELLQEVSHEIEAMGGRAAIVAGDVAESGTARRAVETACREFGGVDIGILNAGIDIDLPARAFDLESAEHVLRVNIGGTLVMIAAILPVMLRQGYGRIVAISSLAAYRGMPGSSAYSASKAAVNTLMESLRCELHASGISFSTISPGFVDTPMTRKNRFPMPFLMSSEKAATKIIRAIDRGRTEYRFPLGTSLGMRALEMMPNFLYDLLMSRIRMAGERATVSPPASSPPSP